MTINDRPAWDPPQGESMMERHYRLQREQIQATKEQNYIPEEYPGQRVHDNFVGFMACLFVLGLGFLIAAIIVGVS